MTNMNAESAVGLSSIPLNRQTCDSEPIHIPGAIQPHGMLISFDAKTFHIKQVSANCHSFVGRSAESLLNQPLATLFGPAATHVLKDALSHDDLRQVNPLSLEVDSESVGRMQFDGILSRYNGALILELEVAHTGQDITFFSLDHSVRQSVLAVQGAKTVAAACEHVAREIRKLSGFDRVLVYEFDERWNGVVLAEDRAPEMDSYMGQRFPASDIPAQARNLYSTNWIRLIGDANYEPVPLIPANDPETGLPLDLSLSVLRSVSPVHLEYMRNMQTFASMSVSVMKDDKLWGLIACHHPSPHFLSYKVRSVCEFLGQIFSSQISSIQVRDREEKRKERKALLAEIDRSLRSAPDLPLGFASNDYLLRLGDSTGAALALRGNIYRYGECPSQDQVASIVKWLEVTMTEELFVSDQLSSVYAPASSYIKVAAGLMAIHVTDDPEMYLLWFRPELVKTVEWAGKPEKEKREGESDALHPRKSFAIWQDVEREKSAPFREFDHEAVADLRTVVLLKLVSKANKDLEESNGELESFATIVAHDLKEPLRGMRNYTSFVLEDCFDNLDEDSQRRLKAAVTLGGELENLLTSLYDYSRMGRVEFSVDSVSLQMVLNSVLNRLAILTETHKVEIFVPRPLPTLICDRIRVGEIFQNLISNAIKYNTNEVKTIEISYREPTSKKPAVFCVKDNGIGIDPRHHQEIFKIFKRLHARQEYPGGTGTGLAIVKRLVDRHSGEIWVESAVGQGSAFHFTLAPDKDSFEDVSRV